MEILKAVNTFTKFSFIIIGVSFYFICIYEVIALSVLKNAQIADQKCTVNWL